MYVHDTRDKDDSDLPELHQIQKNLIPHSLKEHYIQNLIMQFTFCSTIYLDYLDMSYPGCRSLCLSQECNRAAHILQVLGWTPFAFRPALFLCGIDSIRC